MYFNDNKTLYPTPPKLAGDMWRKIPKKERGKIHFVLDPQAGLGNIIETIQGLEYNRHYIKFFAIEKDETLCATLRGKKITVIANDFLTYSGPDKFDAIIMNPPFNNGDQHLLKAISIMYSGHIVCQLNAETVRNPKTRLQKELADKLIKLNADIEYRKQEYAQAQRRTNVEIALIHIHIKREVEQDLFDGMTSAPKDAFENIDEIEGEKAVAEKESIRTLVADYNEKVEIGTQTIMDYYRNTHKIGGYMTLKCGSEEDNRFLCDDTSLTGIMKFKLNSFIETIRKDYWGRALDLKDIRKRLTSKRRDEFYQNQKDNAYMDFTENNIRTFILNLINSYEAVLTKAVLEIFDTMTTRFHYHDSEPNDNIHYFSGWKTNKAFYVNRKVILPCWGFMGGQLWDSDWKRWSMPWDGKSKLADIDIVMNYFDGSPHIYYMGAIQKFRLI